MGSRALEGQKVEARERRFAFMVRRGGNAFSVIPDGRPFEVSASTLTAAVLKLRAWLQAQPGGELGVSWTRCDPPAPPHPASIELTACTSCDDPFTDTGPASRSLADPRFCVHCYVEGAA